MFSTQEEKEESKRESVREIPLSEISDFPNHPFKVKADESMMEMAESVREYGVLALLILGAAYFSSLSVKEYLPYIGNQIKMERLQKEVAGRDGGRLTGASCRRRMGILLHG